MNTIVRIPEYKLAGLSMNESKAYVIHKLKEAKIPISSLGAFVRTGKLVRDRSAESMEIIYIYIP